MKKHLFTCFLALLCLFGSETSSQSRVAESPPGADLLPRFTGPTVSPHSGDTHRGGPFSRPDTFLTSNPHEIDGGPQSVSLSNRRTSDGEPKTANCSPLAVGLPTVTCDPETAAFKKPGFSLVDNPTSQGQEEIPSAQVGEGSVLIYGELINPDSLAPLTLSFSEGHLSQGRVLRDSSIRIELVQGAFFDGVLDPRVQKFYARVPVDQGPVLLNLRIGQRSLLQNYLAEAGDSVKIGVDLQDYAWVFSGPQALWFEAQYQIKRAIAGARFESARVVLEDDREELLDQGDNRAQMLAQDSVFGARIAIYEFGKDGLDQEKAILLDSTRERIPGWTLLQSYRNRLPTRKMDLLESHLLGAFYAGHLSTFRRYHYGMPLALGDSASAQRAKTYFPTLLAKLDKDLAQVLAQGLSPGALDFAREWSATERVITGETLEASIAGKYQPPVRDRLLLSQLRSRLSLGGIPEDQWEYFAELLAGSTVSEGFNAAQSTFRPGIRLAPATFYNLEGREVSLQDYQGLPALLYFYFTGCTHSGNYFRNFLWPFYQEVGKGLGLQLIAISVDKDPELWKRELLSYSTREIINLNLPEDSGQDWLARYLVSGYPRAMLLDQEGKVLSHSLGGKDYEEYKSRILSLLESAQPIAHSSNL